MDDYVNKNRTIKLIRAAVCAAALQGSGIAYAQTALPGSDLILPVDAPPTADMVNLKTENSGSSSFSIVISNTGSVAVTGAIVKDTGGDGGVCQTSNSVIITGNGVPEGSFTVGNLNAPGIVLGTLQPGQSATLTYTCQGQ